MQGQFIKFQDSLLSKKNVHVNKIFPSTLLLTEHSDSSGPATCSSISDLVPFFCDAPNCCLSYDAM
jgi:hypothetical protein